MSSIRRRSEHALTHGTTRADTRGDPRGGARADARQRTCRRTLVALGRWSSAIVTRLNGGAPRSRPSRDMKTAPKNRPFKARSRRWASCKPSERSRNKRARLRRSSYHHPSHHLHLISSLPNLHHRFPPTHSRHDPRHHLRDSTIASRADSRSGLRWRIRAPTRDSHGHSRYYADDEEEAAGDDEG